MIGNHRDFETLNLRTMSQIAAEQLVDQMKRLNPSIDSYATEVLDLLIEFGLRSQASDIHVEKNSHGLIIRIRQLGRLIELGQIPDGTSTQLIARIKAAARLVSYRSDIPQEGRIRLTVRSVQQDARVGTLPLVDGERAVIRLAAPQSREWLPEQLGLPPQGISRLLVALEQPSGVILFTGAAGSGKTTSAYAAMRHLVQKSSVPRSLVSLEDPVEAVIGGVSQSQISSSGVYTWEDGLKAILRQDPEVLLIGEIRDDLTARLVFQAAMAGQLVITTLHARSAADSLRRLLDMQVPVHHLLSSLEFLVCQRLGVRPAEYFDQIASATQETDPVATGRQLTCELLPPIEAGLAQALIAGAGGREIELAARQVGMETFSEQWHPHH